MNDMEEHRKAHRLNIIEEVAAERARQVEVEGFDAAHDDLNAAVGGLAIAASCYALAAGLPDAARADYGPGSPPNRWPWRPGWWKPKDRRRDLIRAAALIVAEVERLDRAAGGEVVGRAFPPPDFGPAIVALRRRLASHASARLVVEQDVTAHREALRTSAQTLATLGAEEEAIRAAMGRLGADPDAPPLNRERAALEGVR